MDIGTDTISNKGNWHNLYEVLDTQKRSPFFSYQYYNAFKTLDSSRVECFWAYKDEENFLFYPYLMKSINDLGYNLHSEYHDISGAYGYNGPIGIVKDDLFLRLYNSELRSHLLSCNVVTELVRYCPVIGNRMLHTYTQQIDVLDNVYIDLSKGLDNVWNNSFEYRVRKTVRKGVSYGLKTSIKRGQAITEADIKCFHNIYTDTMNRKEANSFYFFDLDFFFSLHDSMGAKILLATTFLENIAVSTELVLIDGDLSFGFLGGTLAEYFSYKANTYQRWELIKYLIDIGIMKYSIGGGSSRRDSIYSFKKSFAKGCDNLFYIGTEVHLPEIYKEIVNQWKQKTPKTTGKHSDKIQCYRN